MDKRLCRSKQNKVLAGVCGGIAEYFGIDAAIIRLIWIVLAFAGGSGIIAYIIAVIIMPERSGDQNDFNSGDGSSDSFDKYSTRDSYSNYDHDKNKIIIGGILIVLGMLFLAKQLFNWINFSFMGPVILILIGVAIIYKGRGKFY